jgi:hypothetical protein
MVTAGASQTQTQHASSVPFRGQYTQEGRARFEPPDTLVITADLTGTATHLGQFTAKSEGRGDGNTGTGTITFSAANGDQLFCETVGLENEFIPPNVSKVVMTISIVGGTGRFSGATGSFTLYLTETIDFASSTSRGFGSFDGHIALR